MSIMTDSHAELTCLPPCSLAVLLIDNPLKAYANTKATSSYTQLGRLVIRLAWIVVTVSSCGRLIIQWHFKTAADKGLAFMFPEVMLHQF